MIVWLFDKVNDGDDDDVLVTDDEGVDSGVPWDDEIVVEVDNAEAEADSVIVTDDVIVTEEEDECIGLSDIEITVIKVIDGVIEDVKYSLSEPVFEELAPAVRDDVGVLDVERDKLCVEVGVIEDVEVPLPVALAVSVLLSEDEVVVLSVAKLLDVIEELEPNVIDDVGDNEIDWLDEMVDEGDWEGVPDTDEVTLPVGVIVEVTEIVVVLVNEMVDVIDEVPVGDGVSLADAPSESVVVGVSNDEDDKLFVVDNVSLLEDVWEDVGVEVDVPEAVLLLVIDEVVLTLSVVEEVPVSEPEGVDDGEAERLKVDDAVWLLDGVIEIPEIVLEQVVDAVPDSELVGVGTGVAEKLADRVSILDGVWEEVDWADIVFDEVGVTVASALIVFEAVPDTELDGVCESEEERLSVVEGVAGLDRVWDDVIEAVNEFETVPETDVVLVPLELIVVEDVPEFVGGNVDDGVDERLDVVDEVWLLDNVFVLVGVPVDVEVALRDAVRDAVTLGVHVDAVERPVDEQHGHGIGASDPAGQ